MKPMNYIVYLDARAGELEKILSGVKTMLVKEVDPARTCTCPVSPGDSLYFLRNKDECALRGKATVVRVLLITNHADDELSRTLKEMQPRLQLTEDQYNFWSEKKQVLLVEFDAAHKTDVIQIIPPKTADQSDWITLEAFSLITE
jgi:hypothetical protein